MKGEGQRKTKKERDEGEWRMAKKERERQAGEEGQRKVKKEREGKRERKDRERAKESKV